MNLTVVDPPRQTLIPPLLDPMADQMPITTEADELLLMMQQAVQQTLRSEKLKALLCWATQVANDSTEPSHPAAKRAAALALVLERAFTRRGTASH